MFDKQEALDFIINFLHVENAESLLENNRKELLEGIVLKIHQRLPFQNINLLSVPPNERRKPTQNEMTENYTSGIGGLCFDLNIPTFHLLSALGFEMTMMHSTVTTTFQSRNNHIVLIAKNLVQEGDRYLVDIGCGHPTFKLLNLDFEKESPVYVSSYLEYKYIKYEGKLLRMHRKGDPLVARGVQENSEIEFWIDGWRRFYSVDLDVETKDPKQFDEDHKIVYTNHTASSFHLSHKVIIFPDGIATMVINDKTFMDVDGELVITPIQGGDDAIKSKIKEICPAIPEDLILKSLTHWRQSSSTKN